MHMCCQPTKILHIQKSKLNKVPRKFQHLVCGHDLPNPLVLACNPSKNVPDLPKLAAMIETSRKTPNGIFLAGGMFNGENRANGIVLYRFSSGNTQ
jgi:hypothetical protein